MIEQRDAHLLPEQQMQALTMGTSVIPDGQFSQPDAEKCLQLQQAGRAHSSSKHQRPPAVTAASRAVRWPKLNARAHLES